MDLSFLLDYINVITLGICLIVGFLIKNSFTMIDNCYIPLIVTILGIVINVWVNMAITPEIVLGGMISGLSSTGMHQLLTQLINKENQ